MIEPTLTGIYIYPIKSLGGISLQSWPVRKKGLLYDRRWMLVDESNNFLTQRVHHQMALFKPSLLNDALSIQYKDQSIRISFDTPVETATETVTIWDDTVNAHEVNPEYSAWFSDMMNFKCKLVYFPEPYERRVDAAYNINDDHVSLADAYPFLIIGDGSLKDLNERLDVPVPIDRFRPNFTFAGGSPFEEDSWGRFRIGNNRFVRVKPCARCVLTTVDQATGEKGQEPLKTLATFRKRNNKIYFGQNLLTLDELQVSVGDKIFLDNTEQK